MPPYEERFVEGTVVRIASREALEVFQRDWNFHHPLKSAQIEWADREARVGRAMFYHGGDVIYELIGVPGIWHEECLLPRSSSS